MSLFLDASPLIARSRGRFDHCRAMRKQPAAFRHWILGRACPCGAQPVMSRVIPLAVAGSAVWADDSAPVHCAIRDGHLALTTDPASRRIVAPARLGRLCIRYVAIGAVISLAILCPERLAVWLRRERPKRMIAGSRRAMAARATWHSRPVRIAVTTHPALLVTWGAFAGDPVRPARAWSAGSHSLVLAHELAHLIRRDWLIQLLAEMRARDQLVQSAVLDRVRAPAPRERICLRRHRPRFGIGGTRTRRICRSRAHVQRARPHLAAGAVHCTSVNA